MYQNHLNALIAAWNHGDLSGLDAWLDRDTVRIAPAALNSNADNLAELKQVISDFRVAFPDAKVTLEEVFFQEDRSFVRWTFEGTNTGPGNFPPTGKSVRIEGTSLARYAEGKLVEERVYFDALDMLTQVGVMP